MYSSFGSKTNQKKSEKIKNQTGKVRKKKIKSQENSKTNQFESLVFNYS